MIFSRNRIDPSRFERSTPWVVGSRDSGEHPSRFETKTMDAEGAKLKAKSVGRRVHADFRRRIGDGQRRGNLSRD